MTNLLKKLKIEDNWMDGMTEADTAYHVTNLLEMDDQQTIGQEDRPKTYSQLVWNPAQCEFYDGPFLGLPCVFLTTSRWYHRNTSTVKLPTISPYPICGRQDDFHQRVNVPFKDLFDEIENWDFFYSTKTEMWDGINQVHIIVIKNTKSSIFYELTDFEKLNINDPNPFLYYDKNNKSWMTNAYDKPTCDKYFVNLAVVVENIPLNNGKWDTVKKGKETKVKNMFASKHAAAFWLWENFQKTSQRLEETKKELEVMKEKVAKLSAAEIKTASEPEVKNKDETFGIENLKVEDQSRDTQ